MSVPKTQRSISTIKFLSQAREIHHFTFSRVRMFPKSYNFFYTIPLFDLSKKAYSYLKRYEIISMEKHILDDSTHDKQICIREALSCYTDMLDSLDLLYQYIDKEKLPESVLEKWIELIIEEIDMIKKLI